MAAREYLATLQATHPDLAHYFVEMSELHEKKLWHQLTVKLEQFLSLTVLQVRCCLGRKCLLAVYLSALTKKIVFRPETS